VCDGGEVCDCDGGKGVGVGIGGVVVSVRPAYMLTWHEMQLTRMSLRRVQVTVCRVQVKSHMKLVPKERTE